MISLDNVVAAVLADMQGRALISRDVPPAPLPKLRDTVDWTTRAVVRDGIPHLTRAQAAAMLRLRDPRTRRHAWGKLHQSVRAALIRNGLCHRDMEPTKLGELVTAFAAAVLGPTARGEGNKPPRPSGDLRRRF